MSILIKVKRGEFIESIHVAYGVAVDEQGAIVFATGDPHYLTCIRSSLKPFQAVVSVQNGAVDSAGFSEEELAIMCASHNGEEIHVKTVRKMLDKLKFNEDDLYCGSHEPYDVETSHNLIKDDTFIGSVYNNCSGKHAGMLALAKHLNADAKNYIKNDHPVQKTIFEQIQRYTGLDQLSTGIDGCGAPTPFLTLSIIASLYQKLASGNYPELDRIYNAMAQNSYMVAGRERFDTDFISAMKGRAICKVGGEAVRGFGIRKSDGSVLGCAIKVLDGNMRALHPASMAFLNKLKLLDPEENLAMSQYHKPILKNHLNIEVGCISAGIDH